MSRTDAVEITSADLTTLLMHAQFMKINEDKPNLARLVEDFVEDFHVKTRKLQKLEKMVNTILAREVLDAKKELKHEGHLDFFDKPILNSRVVDFLCDLEKEVTLKEKLDESESGE